MFLCVLAANDSKILEDHAILNNFFLFTFYCPEKARCINTVKWNENNFDWNVNHSFSSLSHKCLKKQPAVKFCSWLESIRPTCLRFAVASQSSYTTSPYQHSYGSWTKLLICTLWLLTLLILMESPLKGHLQSDTMCLVCYQISVDFFIFISF